MQHIINQKEEIITRLQNLLKKNGEEHAQNILQLVREMKILKDSVDSKEQICNRFVLNFLSLIINIRLHYYYFYF